MLIKNLQADDDFTFEREEIEKKPLNGAVMLSLNLITWTLTREER